MSRERDIFESEVSQSERNGYGMDRWATAIDNLSCLSMWEMLRALDKLKQAKRLEVVEISKIIMKERGWGPAAERIGWAAEIVGSNQFTPPRSGLFQKQSGMSETSEETDAKVFLAEKQAQKKPEIITLGQPSLACNAMGINTRYKMQHTETIAKGVAARALVDLILKKGELKHLAISCHGFVNHADGATTVSLGAGLDRSNVGEFSRLKGKVGVIWIGGCLAAASDPGKEDCKARAKDAECFLVAPALLMTAGTGDLPQGRMDMNRRFMPVVVNPKGELISWDTFLKMGIKLNFTVS